MSTLELVQKHIHEGNLSEAQAALDHFAPQETLDWRMAGHFQGIIHIRQGNLKTARSVLESTLMNFGENVKLLRDLACCYHEMHEMHLFRATQSRLEFTLQEKWADLSFSSRFNVQLMIAKFREEDGRVAIALHNYRQLLDLSQRDEEKGLREVVLAQLVRSQALYEPKHPLNSYYSELIGLGANEFTAEVNIEVEHALMLAELVLIGPEHSWIRVQQAVQNPHVIAIDKRLMFYDFLEGCLANGFSIPMAAFEMKDEFSGRDLYEDQVHTLAFDDISKISLLELTQLASRLSWSSYVRILCVVANLQREDYQRVELQKKILILLGSLDEESQMLWKRRLKDVFNQTETKLEFSMLRRSLYFSGSSLDLSRKKGMLQLLEHLAQLPKITIDDAIQKLWQVEFSPEHYHRLRMMVHRLNRLVHEFTSLGKIVEVDSESVRLKPGIRIIAQEMSTEIVGNLSS